MRITPPEHSTWPSTSGDSVMRDPSLDSVPLYLGAENRSDARVEPSMRSTVPDAPVTAPPFEDSSSAILVWAISSSEDRRPHSVLVPSRSASSASFSDLTWPAASAISDLRASSSSLSLATSPSSADARESSSTLSLSLPFSSSRDLFASLSLRFSSRALSRVPSSPSTSPSLASRRAWRASRSFLRFETSPLSPSRSRSASATLSLRPPTLSAWNFWDTTPWSEVMGCLPLPDEVLTMSSPFLSSSERPSSSCACVSRPVPFADVLLIVMVAIRMFARVDNPVSRLSGMSLFVEHSYSRVMVFIDYRNVYEVLETTGDGLRMDLFRLTQILVGTRDLVGAYVFDGRKRYVRRDDSTEQLHNGLRGQGFRVIARDSVVFEDGKMRQKEVDVSLACEMLEHALLNNFDVAILVSGDRDFVPVIQKVQAAGKRVEVAAFDGEFSQEVKRAADVYYVMNDMPFLYVSTSVPEGSRWEGRTSASGSRST